MSSKGQKGAFGKPVWCRTAAENHDNLIRSLLRKRGIRRTKENVEGIKSRIASNAVEKRGFFNWRPKKNKVVSNHAAGQTTHPAKKEG